MDFREEGPECETPGIFISVDGESGLSEAALLDSSLEGPLPKVEGCPPTHALGLSREALVRAGAEGALGAPGLLLFQEAAPSGLTSKEERSPQTLTAAGEDAVKTPSPAAEDAGEPEAKGNS